ncbi:MAG: hypothetical protein DWQ44_02085 [Bacteroidetes bacterium]|nr:MAG: hypothetical protein DWQ33_05815 [Bacteroidota bacterium]REK04764.1 MAG: hypothetical protein DWQ39_05980 [Bacteroidota bacterium]REK36238.1 MAG: hypothetical protein DWQ44_02085 [Bacteroidota bacterium]REK51100.1 MAG: hypothetical protein DWQ48_03140 [Bacteroidota bacterium]
MKHFSYILIIVSGLLSCTDESGQPELFRPDNCDSTAFSYSRDIRPIISANCSYSSCHAQGGTGSYDYNDYAVLADRIRAGRFVERLDLPVDNPLHMPEGFRMNPCELYKLKVWILQGYSNN